jgi:CheY-like chemotaxis protein
MDPLGNTPAVRATAPLATGPERKRVLVADDEEAVRVVFRRYFTRGGWQVVEVADGRQARDRLLDGARTHFDLVICDLRMPGMSGPELFRSIQDVQPELVARLLFTTGDPHEAAMADFLAAAGCGVLAKPFELATLRSLIESVTARAAA